MIRNNKKIRKKHILKKKTISVSEMRVHHAEYRTIKSTPETRGTNLNH